MKAELDNLWERIESREATLTRNADALERARTELSALSLGKGGSEQLLGIVHSLGFLEGAMFANAGQDLREWKSEYNDLLAKFQAEQAQAPAKRGRGRPRKVNASASATATTTATAATAPAPEAQPQGVN